MKLKLIILFFTISLTSYSQTVQCPQQLEVPGSNANELGTYINTYKYVCDTFIIDFNESPIWIIDAPVELDFFSNNITFIFKGNVVVESLDNFPIGRSMFEVKRSVGIKFIGEGQGATMRMNNETYNQTVLDASGNIDVKMTKSKLEAMFCIGLFSTENIEVSNLQFKNAITDPIYLGNRFAPGVNPYCKDIKITDCKFFNSARNDISVISVDGLEIDQCYFSQTGFFINSSIVDNTNMADYFPPGPWAGIDIEPNPRRCGDDDDNPVCVGNDGIGGEIFKNIIISKCEFVDTKEAGITFDIRYQNIVDNVEIIDVYVHSTNEALGFRRNGIKFKDGRCIYTNLSNKEAPIILERCVIENTKFAGLYFENWRATDNGNILINNCVLHTPEIAGFEAPIYFDINDRSLNSNDKGKVIIKNCDLLSENSLLFKADLLNSPMKEITINTQYLSTNTVPTSGIYGNGGSSSINININPIISRNTVTIPGDYNGDGKTDLFVKGFSKWRSLYTANPDGESFTTEFSSGVDNVGGTDNETFFTNPEAKLYPGDYNADGETDFFVKGHGTYRALYLAKANGAGFKRVFMGNTDNIGGTDSEPFFTNPDANIYVGDYNGDGADDLFVKGYSTWRGLYLSDMVNNTFQNKFKRVFPFGDPNTPEGEDGYDDEIGGTDSEPFFTDPSAEIHIGDYNNDGATDFFVKGYSTWRGLYLSDMNGNTFQNKFKRVFPAGGEDGYMDEIGGTDSEIFFTDPSAKIYTGDYNGDGATDLFVKGESTWRGLYLSDMNDNTFQNKFKRVFPADGEDGYMDEIGGTDSEIFFTDPSAKIYTGDYNGDGATDLFVKGESTWRGLYLSEMNGNIFQNKFKRVFPSSGEDGYMDGIGGTDNEPFFTDPSVDIYPGDYNGDGATDLFVKGHSSSWRGLYLSEMNNNIFQNKFKRTLPSGDQNNGGENGSDSFLRGTHKFSWFVYNETLQNLNLKISSSNDKVDVYSTYNLNTNKFDNDIILYPNPTKGIVHIKNSHGLKNIRVYNISGVLLLENLNYKDENINLSSFQSGIYFIEITSVKDNYVTKILKK